MNNYNYDYIEEERSIDLNRYLVSTFGLLAAGLALSTLAGAVISRYFLSLLFENRAFILIAIMVQLALVINLSARITKMETVTAWLSYFGYCLITGINFAFLMLSFEITSMVMAFGMTAVVFTSMAIIGLTGKVDFTKFGSYFMVGLLAIIIISILNVFFFKAEGLSLFVLYGGVILFLGLTAYDVQKIRNIYYEVQYDDKLRNNFMVYGAFQLYLDFVNLFIYILRIFGRRRN